MAEENVPLEETPARPVGLNSVWFAAPTYFRHPWHLARQQRNIENNQYPIYGEMSQGSSPNVRGSPSSSSPPLSSNVDTIPVNVMTKEDYVKILKDKRRTFVHSNFGNVLSDLFAMLRKDAESSKHCHREVTFEIPEHFDIDRTEKMLCDYFADNGFKALPEGRKDTNHGRIVITIT